MLPVKYDVTEAALSDLKTRYHGLVIKDHDSYEIVRKGIAECRTLRVALENQRKDLKADALEYGRKVDFEAKRITMALLEIEEPLKAEKDREDARKEAIRQEKAAKEKARQDAIRAKIDAIKDLVIQAQSQTSIEINVIYLKLLEKIIVADEFEEFHQDALDAWMQTIEGLRHTMDMKALMEREEAARKEEAARLEKIRQEQEAEAKRLAEVQKAADEKARIEREAIETERRKIEEEKTALEASKKAEAERKAQAEREAAIREEERQKAQEKAEREAKEKADREAVAPDREKLLKWIGSFNETNIPSPSLKSMEAKEIHWTTMDEIQIILQAAEKKAREL